jgi:glycosyltransferase involved in cell wall biosynthesis
LESKVAFFGALSGTALRALYRECDVFCLPSRTDSFGDKEGFPNVIAEAMAFGKPVVSTLHAGIPEIVNEVLVPENDVEQLALALKKVCDSVEYRKELGKNNRSIVEENFSPSNSDRVEGILLKYSGK